MSLAVAMPHIVARVPKRLLANTVSYEDALAYAAWAGQQLPTEIEWEYAARAGGPPTMYAWEMTSCRAASGWPTPGTVRFPWESLDEPGKDRTTPIGRFPANAWGLVDMIGNVWEWTTSQWTEHHSGRAAGLRPIWPRNTATSRRNTNSSTSLSAATTTPNGDDAKHRRATATPSTTTPNDHAERSEKTRVDVIDPPTSTVAASARPARAAKNCP
jgi:formylglycine-generating enzyme required for sulfatase activity